MLKSGKQWRRSGIVVPEVVVDELKSPDEFPRFSTQSDDGIRPLAIAGAETAVIVGAGTAGGNEDKVTFGIDDHDGPGVASASAPRFVGRLLRRDGDVGRKRLPFPAERTGSNIEGANDAIRHFGAGVVVDGRTDDDDVVDDGGGEVMWY